jgi:DNA/RNA-binding domain of Phe-tRNA-synthetase-like protein
MSETIIVGTDRWRAEHAGSAAAAVIYRSVRVVDETPELAAMKRELEQRLRDRWGMASKAEILADPVLAVYQQYDQRFGQNYHVAMQIRSIAQKGKEVPSRNALIEAMFMTELATGVLASAQDLDQIALPIVVDSADGQERYIRYDGVEESCKAGDQLMADADGHVLTSIAQGPTSHGLVTDATTSIVYCFYFPAGVPELVMDDAVAYLDGCVRAASPGAERGDHELVWAEITP